MKGFFVFVLTSLFLLTGVRSASAQDWRDLLQQAADAATALNGKASELKLAGRWVYSAPAMKMTGEDVLSGIAAAALEKAAEKKMSKVYEKVGLKPGVGVLTLCKENRYEATTGERTVRGGYEYDSKARQITFSFDSKKRSYAPVTGRAYVKGDELVIVFPVTKLVEMVKTIGDRVPQLNGLASLFERYKDVYIGFTFRREGAAKE